MANDQIPFLECAELGCSEIETLVNYYVDGELAEALHERFHAHLAECEGCRQLLADSQHLLEIAKTLDSGPIPAAVSRRLRIALRERTGCDLTMIPPRLSLVKRSSAE